MKKYDLVGIDGNAFAVMGYVTKCMRSENMDKESIDNYLKDAKSSDYNHLLCVSIDMIEFLNEQYNERNGIEDDEYDIEDDF